MSSTASFIDRRTSSLRSHQILALLTHLITHKPTISIEAEMAASAARSKRHHSRWRTSVQCTSTRRHQASNLGSQQPSIGWVTNGPLSQNSTPCGATTDAEQQSPTILDRRWQEHSPTCVSSLHHLFPSETYSFRDANGRSTIQQSDTWPTLFNHWDWLLWSSIHQGTTSKSRCYKGLCSNIRLLHNTSYSHRARVRSHHGGVFISITPLRRSSRTARGVAFRQCNELQRSQQSAKWAV